MYISFKRETASLSLKRLITSASWSTGKYVNTSAALSLLISPNILTISFESISSRSSATSELFSLFSSTCASLYFFSSNKFSKFSLFSNSPSPHK